VVLAAARRIEVEGRVSGLPDQVQSENRPVVVGGQGVRHLLGGAGGPVRLDRQQHRPHRERIGVRQPASGAGTGIAEYEGGQLQPGEHPVDNRGEDPAGVGGLGSPQHHHVVAERGLAEDRLGRVAPPADQPAPIGPERPDHLSGAGVLLGRVTQQTLPPAGGPVGDRQHGHFGVREQDLELVGGVHAVSASTGGKENPPRSQDLCLRSDGLRLQPGLLLLAGFHSPHRQPQH